jgi:hypothetical protein
MSRKLIRNATAVITVDPALGELQGADILVEDDLSRGKSVSAKDESPRHLI